MKIVNASEIKRRSIDLLEATRIVLPIIQDVKEQGDKALLKYAKQLDQKNLTEIAVSKERIEEAKNLVSNECKQAMKIAKENISAYHAAQLPKEWWLEVAPGIMAGQLVRPLGTVGCYIPGGKYPLVSTVLMTAVPAKVAGVEKVIVCTPHAVPEILVACELAGVDCVYEIGGAQAIASMAYGTETIPKVDKIVGPGNRFVTAAKKVVYGDVGIDFLAGPSEVLIIADESGDPCYIAADLLAQAEHDEEAIPILVTTSRSLVDRVLAEINQQLEQLPTRSTAKISLEKNGMIVFASSLDQAFDVSNQFAPEHLEIHLEDKNLLKKVKNAGSVFLGKYSAEVFGDYVTGPNHVLPTGGVAAFQSGLSLSDFLKKVSVQYVTRQGAFFLSNAAATLARMEGLEAHARAVDVRTMWHKCQLLESRIQNSEWLCCINHAIRESGARVRSQRAQRPKKFFGQKNFGQAKPFWLLTPGS